MIVGAPGPEAIQAPPAARRRGRGARVLVVTALLAGSFGCDQATKRAATALLPDGERVVLAGGLVRLERVLNRGAFLGLGAGMPERARALVFTWGVAALSLGALALALHRASPRRTAVAAALVAGGGLGNLWDRVTAGGAVTDFLNVGVGPLRTGIFNVADVAIMAGVVLLALPAARPRPRA